MFFIYLLFFFHAFAMIDSKKSFTIVLDTTKSMNDDIEIIKSGIRTLMNDLVNQTDFQDYIIVPFNYPGKCFYSITYRTNAWMLVNVKT